MGVTNLQPTPGRVPRPSGGSAKSQEVPPNLAPKNNVVGAGGPDRRRRRRIPRKCYDKGTSGTGHECFGPRPRTGLPQRLPRTVHGCENRQGQDAVPTRRPIPTKRGTAGGAEADSGGAYPRPTTTAGPHLLRPSSVPSASLEPHAHRAPGQPGDPTGGYRDDGGSAASQHPPN